MPVETARSARLILRKPIASDLDTYTAYCASPRAQYVGGPYDTFQAFEKFASLIGHWEIRGFGRLILTDAETGRPMGHVGAMQIVASEPPEMTWTLWNGEDEGKGYASEAAQAYVDQVAGTIGYSGLLVRIERGNIASQRLAERIGAVLDESAPPPSWMSDGLTYRLAV